MAADPEGVTASQAETVGGGPIDAERMAVACATEAARWWAAS